MVEYNDNERIIKFFRQHIVPILFLFEKEDRQQQFLITTFVFSVSNYWFLLTAGHCFQQIKHELLDKGWIIKNCYLIDSLGINATFNEPIPFPFDIQEALFFSDILDHDLAYDYGLYPLSAYFQKMLLTNNVNPLNEEVWKKQPVSFEIFILLGIPSELVKYDENNIQFFPVIFYVDFLSDKPDGFSYVSLPQIYGKIKLQHEVKSIKGMSGGPLFGLKEYEIGELRYWLIGLQSRWLPESHYIAACPTKYIGQLIESFLSEND